MTWPFLIALLWMPQSDPLRQALLLEESGRQEAALEICLQVLQAQPQRVEALTQASHLYGVLGSYSADDKTRREHYDRALELAQNAHDLQPDDAEANFVMAWALGGHALLSGSREKVRLAQRMKSFLDKTLQLRPDHHRAWYVLGNWRSQVAGANLLERAAARAYAKAVELKPDSILYLFHYARALADLRRGPEAEEICRKVLQLTPKAPDDHRLLLRARVLLKSLK